MSEVGNAVFISYASQDAEAAQRICDALRAAGIEVWFDQSELRAGDTWDAKIRKQIKECALFVPIISANTQARLEGYFRIEWKLAAQRTHAMADAKPFLMPIVLDDTSDAAAHVPDEFRAVQWTRIAGGDSLRAFCERAGALLRESTPAGGEGAGRGRVKPAAQPPIDFAALSAVGPAKVEAKSTKSVAVLAFANLSHDPENEYFSDGISEELLNVLAKVPGLRVTARTSSFYFKGKNLPVPRIAQELGVSYIVEGSVRKAGTRVRITAQLIDAVEDTHLWSETFDRELKDIFAVQDEIAGLIAQSLQVTLGRATRKTTTVDPEAFRLCLEGRRGLQFMSEESVDRAEQLFQRALAISPNLPMALAGLAQAGSIRILITGASVRFREAELKQAEQRARDAVQVDPQNGDAHIAVGLAAATLGRIEEARVAYGRGIELGASSESLVSCIYCFYCLRIGRPDRAVTLMERLRPLDPISWLPADEHGASLLYAGNPAEAIPMLQRAEELGSAPVTYAHHAIALAQLGRNEEAVRVAREALRRCGPVAWNQDASVDQPATSNWGNGFLAIIGGLAAWALAAAGAREEAEALALRFWIGPERFRWNAGIPFLLQGRLDDGFAVLADTPQLNVGFALLSFLHDHPSLQKDPRCHRLLEQLGATEHFETFKRVRRGEKLP